MVVIAAACASIALCGCVAPTFRMRVSQPSGTELLVLRGPFTAERTLSVPFVATFQPMGMEQHYEVRLRVPSEIASRLGGRGETELPGELHVYPATEIARSNVAELPLDEQRLGRLLRGEIAEASWWVEDPNVENGQLAHLTLHGAR
jgi:hypothetical protein